MMGHGSVAGDGDIGAASLPATRPLCIPVRFQPTSMGARWAGTGALATAAATLPPPLAAADLLPSPSSALSASASDVRPPAGGATDSFPNDPCATAGAAGAHGGGGAGSGGCWGDARSWVWAAVAVAVLVAVVAGAAWGLVRHRRRRARPAVDAGYTAPAQTQTTAGAIGSPIPSAAVVDLRPPHLPLPLPLQQRQPYPGDEYARPTLGEQPYAGAGALAVPLHPLSPHAVVQAPSLIARQETVASNAVVPQSPIAVDARGEAATVWSPERTVGLGAPGAWVATQQQARGTYLVVERPPSAPREGRVGPARDTTDVSSPVMMLRRAPATAMPDENDGGERNRAWPHHAQPQPPADSRRPRGAGAAYLMADMRGSPVMGAPGSPTMARAPPMRRPRPPASPDWYGHSDEGSQSGDEGAHYGDNDDDDGDYWGPAERARRTYFASPEERAAQVMRLGPRAYSPDGTPMIA
jgi:hypothetical protein